MSSSSSKILGLKQLACQVEGLRRVGQKIVFTNGCFDLLHLGHVRYLEQAKALGDVLVVAVNSDDSVRALKGEGRPLIPESQRAQIIAALACVDFVTIFSDPDPIPTIQALRPDVHVKGGDYTEEQLPEAEVVKAYGGEVVIIPQIDAPSTSNLIERIGKLGIRH